MAPQPPAKRRKTTIVAPPTDAVGHTVATAPLSAVAARKAALAAAAQTAVEDNRGKDFNVIELVDGSEDAISSLSFSSSSSGLSSDDEEGGDKADAYALRLLERQRRKDASRKSTKDARYFAGEAAPDDPVELESQAHEFQQAARIKLGRGKRQRRDKSAFTDPECISKFQPVSEQNVFAVNDPSRGKVQTLFCLKAGETLVIHGTYSVVPVFGSVSILAATLNKSPSEGISHSTFKPHKVFAPSSHPLPVIDVLPHPDTRSLTTITLPNGQSIDVSPFDAAIFVEDFVSGIESIESVLRAAGLGVSNGMWPTPLAMSSSWQGNTWQLICESTPTLTSIRMPESWLAGLTESLVKPDDGDRMVCLVEGPKRSGKSTFARLLLNALVSRYGRVAYLDTDLGQPEFSAPGFVSLSVVFEAVLGAPFTHVSVPTYSHFLGTLSPASDPSGYLNAIAALLSSYRLEVEISVSSQGDRRTSPCVPLVINTQGWVKGLGADLLAKIKEMARPERIFAFESDNDYETAVHDGLPTETSSVQRKKLAPAPSSPLESKWSPTDLRTLSLVAYFYAKFPDLISSEHSGRSNQFPVQWDFSKALVTRPPYAVEWSREAAQILEVHTLHDGVPHRLILHALNASIVAVVLPLSSDREHSDSISPFPYAPGRAPPSPTETRALGLAIIRSISPSSNTLHILTPIPVSHMSHPVHLVRGALELPLPLWLDFAASQEERETGIVDETWKQVPYIDAGGGEGRRRARRNLMRRSQT